jgi:hypothetical protein
LFSINTGDEEDSSTRARTEIDGQQNVGKPTPKDEEAPVPSVTKTVRNIWSAKLLD